MSQVTLLLIEKSESSNKLNYSRNLIITNECKRPSKMGRKIPSIKFINRGSSNDHLNLPFPVYKSSKRSINSNKGFDYSQFLGASTLKYLHDSKYPVGNFLDGKGSFPHMSVDDADFNSSLAAKLINLDSLISKGLSKFEILDEVYNIRQFISYYFHTKGNEVSSYEISQVILGVMLALNDRGYLFTSEIDSSIINVIFRRKNTVLTLDVNSLSNLTYNDISVYNPSSQFILWSYHQGKNKWVPRLSLDNGKYSPVYFSITNDFELDLFKSYIIDTLDDSEFYQPVESHYPYFHLSFQSNLPDDKKLSLTRIDPLLRTVNCDPMKAVFRELISIPPMSFNTLSYAMDMARKEEGFKQKFSKSLLDTSELNRLEKLISKPFKIGTLDIETLTNADGSLYPYIITYYDGVKFQSYHGNDCVDKMVDYLMTISDFTRIYVHNGAKFDYLFLLKAAFSRRYSPRIMHRDKTMITFTLGNSPIIFCDSYRLLMCSLKSASKAFNVPLSKECPFHELYNLESFNDSSKLQEAIHYNQDDCYALYHIMVKFNDLLKLHNLSLNLGNTISSLAYSGFKYLYATSLKGKLNTNSLRSLDSETYEFIKKSYLGGIVDVFQRLKVDTEYFSSSKEGRAFLKSIPSETYLKEGNRIKYFDLVSSYPSSMVGNMPIGDPIKFNPSNKIPIKDLPIGFYDVSFKVPNGAAGIFFHRFNGKILSKIGDHNLIMTSEELKYYYSINEIVDIRINSGYVYESSSTLFNHWVKLWGEVKASHNKSHPLYFISKIFLNSLYGMFAVSPKSSSFFNISSDISQEQVTRLSELGIKSTGVILADENLASQINGYISAGILSKKSILPLSRKSRPSNINIGISSLITAKSRILLTDMIYKLGIKNVFYCDTDSVVFESNGDYSNLNIGSKLGCWKDEYPSSRIILYVSIAPKVYSLLLSEGEKIIEVVKFKGMKASASEYSSMGHWLSDWSNRNKESGSTNTIGILSNLLYNIPITSTFSSLKRDKSSLNIYQKEISRSVKKGNLKRKFTSLNSSSPIYPSNSNIPSYTPSNSLSTISPISFNEDSLKRSCSRLPAILAPTPLFSDLLAQASKIKRLELENIKLMDKVNRLQAIIDNEDIRK